MKKEVQGENKKFETKREGGARLFESFVGHFGDFT